MNLPSKKVLSVLIVVSGVVIAVIVASNNHQIKKVTDPNKNLIAGEKISLPENTNWQSELQKISDTKIDVSGIGTSTTETVTDTVGTTLIANYLNLKQNNAFNSSASENLVNQTNNLITDFKTKLVTENNLKVVNDNGLISINEYGENLGNILKNNRPKELKNELQIINEAVSARDSTKINELDGIIMVYEKLSNDMQKMPVPKTFIKAHLDMLNGVIEMASALKEMKQVFADPIKSLTAIKTYQDGTIRFKSAKIATNKFILQNQIVYKQGSGGYYLLYNI